MQKLVEAGPVHAEDARSPVDQFSLDNINGDPHSSLRSALCRCGLQMYSFPFDRELELLHVLYALGASGRCRNSFQDFVSTVQISRIAIKRRANAATDILTWALTRNRHKNWLSPLR